MSWEIGGASLLATLFVFAASALASVFAVRTGFLRPPGGRHIHTRTVPLLGGVAVSFTILVVLLLHPTLVITPQIGAMLIGMMGLTIVGLIDDKQGLRWTLVFAAQAFAGIVLVAGGVRIPYVNGFFGQMIRLDGGIVHAPSFFCVSDPCAFPVFGTLIMLGWILFVVNAFNWLDGTHGAAMLVAGTVFATVIVLSLRLDVAQPPIAILAATGLGAVVGFLMWNVLRGPLLLGNAGSFGLGFFLASLAVLAGAKLATVSMVFLLPAADATAVIAARLFLKIPPWRADMRHLHHELMRRHMKPWQIAVLYAGISGSLGFTALSLNRPWKLFVLLFGFMCMFMIFLYLKLKVEFSSPQKDKKSGGDE